MGYQEYRKELAAATAEADQEEEQFMRSLVGNKLYEKHFKK